MKDHRRRLVSLIATLVIVSAASGQSNYYSEPTTSEDLFPAQVTPQSMLDDSQYYPAPDQESNQRQGHSWQQQVFPADRRNNMAYSSSGYQSGGNYGNSGGNSDGNYGISGGNYGSSGYGAQQNSYSSDTSYSGNSYGGNSYGPSTKSGKRSFIVIDPTNLMNFALQITVPFSFDYSFFGLGRRKRDVSKSGKDDPSGDKEMEDAVDDLLEQNLVNLRNVFTGLGLGEHECIEEMICHIHHRPTDYSPLPDIIKQLLNHDDLKPDYESHFNYINTTNALDYSRYVRAISRGTGGDESEPCSCDGGATKCLMAIDSILDRPVFKFLHYVNNFSKRMRDEL